MMHGRVMAIAAGIVLLALGAARGATNHPELALCREWIKSPADRELLDRLRALAERHAPVENRARYLALYTRGCHAQGKTVQGDQAKKDNTGSGSGDIESSEAARGALVRALRYILGDDEAPAADAGNGGTAGGTGSPPPGPTSLGNMDEYVAAIRGLRAAYRSGQAGTVGIKDIRAGVERFRGSVVRVRGYMAGFHPRAIPVTEQKGGAAKEGLVLMPDTMSVAGRAEMQYKWTGGLIPMDFTIGAISADRLILFDLSPVPDAVP
jgi:hypothetical protein